MAARRAILESAASSTPDQVKEQLEALREERKNTLESIRENFRESRPDRESEGATGTARMLQPAREVTRRCTGITWRQTRNPQ